MTNEEAIRILKNVAVLATSTSYQAIEEAVEVATKALTSATDINVATKDGDMVYRQDAIDALDEIESEVADGDGFQYEKWRKYFTDLPSAQPEIIRCKDCKHRPIEKYGEIMPPKENDWKCPCLCDDYFYSWRPKDNFFCASGERREE